MEASTKSLRILLIRPWTEPIGPLRSALRDADLEATIVRVDIEPGLDAALGRGRFDFVVYDPRTPGITRETVDGCLRTHHERFAPVIVFTSSEQVLNEIALALAQRMN